MDAWKRFSRRRVASTVRLLDSLGRHNRCIVVCIRVTPGMLTHESWPDIGLVEWNRVALIDGLNE
jgi:hypothetical protein